ncbi:hypothetical protein [Stutzerimonas stutzeri]|nr:hypothetical protein [Stutzerimonas stutzeri]
MSILVENGHGENSDEIVKEIIGMGLFPHECCENEIPLGVCIYNADLHFFVISGELEIEADGFPISAHSGAYVHISAGTAHQLIPYENARIYVGGYTKHKAASMSAYVSDA